MNLIIPPGVPPDAVLAFSTRRGGCSPPPFDSLNFSDAEGDKRENAQKNLRILTQRLNIEPQQIAFCQQVHEDAVAVVESVPDQPPIADALIAPFPGVFPAVLTADCLPILLLDTRRKVATAVHAGWKGTLSRITRKVLTVLKRELRTEPSDLFVALGPAIGPCCYEVDENVLAPFRANFPRAASFIVGPAEREQSRAACHVSPAQDSEKGFESNCGNMSQTVPSRKGLPSRRPYRLDLIGANRFELIAEGVPESNIHIIGLCTSCRPDLFFSHRRDAGRTGRHIAIAGFRK